MSALRETTFRLIRPLHGKLRGKKIAAFLGLLDSCPGKLLDIGGAPGLNGEFFKVYRKFANVMLVNVDLNWLPRTQMPADIRLHCILGDGCELPFSSNSVDWVFSNAVIEHVGDWHRQMLFASEIRRVAKNGYFVTTPNKYFPIEQHTWLPLYQWMPLPVQKRVVVFAPGHTNRYENMKNVKLLTPKQMHILFPEATIEKTGLPIFPNSLVAYYQRPALTGRAVVPQAQSCAA